MNWIVKAWNRLHPATPTPMYSTEETRQEAQEARESATQALQVVTDRAPLVERLTDALREQRERNHFADLIEVSMRGNG